MALESHADSTQIHHTSASESTWLEVVLRIIRLGLAWLWAVMLVMAGIGVWQHQAMLAGIVPESLQNTMPAWACLFVGGGQFIFLLLVADDLCPNAPATLSFFLKAFTGSMVWLSILWMILQSR